jgi:hypothetical protein
MEKRVIKIEKQLGAGEPERGMIQFVDTTRWPAADQARYRAGDSAERAALIEAHTGCPLPPPGRHVRFVIDVGPAPMSPGHAAVMDAERILGAGSE